ncbi:hypothetical protein [Falsiroseomonas oryzae]|uniref:hypothetical protein n=1 Tax=Falsiroseomonas oryzae TaxID=2766473 RepID=UPI0022EAC4C1|nr:hypothetical protein [Roseomonas sp. MO-31]
MDPTGTPIALRHRSGGEWMRHIAGRALAVREAERRRAAAAAAWREVAPFIPCG